MFDGLCSPEQSMEEVSEYLPETSTPTFTSSSTFNPFGPAVGTQKHVYSCNYRKSNQKGHLHVATKAVCFRCTILFGWETVRIIIPLCTIIAIDQSDHGTISIKTKNNVLHEMDLFDMDIATVRNSLVSAWKDCEKNENKEDRNTDSVRHLYRSVCLLSEFPDSHCEDSDTEEEEGSDEDSINLSVGRADRNLPCLPDDLEAKMWSELRNSKDEKFTENVAVNIKLNITLDDFFAQFLSDGTTVSLASHHQASGDLDVKTTKWEHEDGLTKKRFISYNHPISIPLPIAPPAGAATKTQRMQRFGDYGICLDTETWINDVPLADCFYVADRLLFSSDPDGQISLTIKFGICFVKKTMFRGIIASTSVNDVTEFHRGYVDLIQSKIANSPQSTPIIRPSTDSNSRVVVQQPNSTVLALKRESKLDKFFDMKLCLIIVLLFLACWEHLYFTRRLDQTTEKLARLENFLLSHAQNEYLNIV